MSWAWDRSLYAGSAAYYGVGRMPYPPGLPAVLRRALDLDGRGRLLDIGCGPGSLTTLIAGSFEAAVGIDADPDMIATARRSGLPHTTWRVLRAEELPAGLGRFRAVTFAQSFHWVDRRRVAQGLPALLDPGGAVVIVGATTHRGVGVADASAPPWEAIGALVRRWLGPEARAGAGTLSAGTPGGEDVILRAAGFRGPTSHEVPVEPRTRRTEDDVVAAVFSLSSSAPHLFGARRAEFEADLRRVLRDRRPDGDFVERRRPITLDVYRAD